MKWIMTQSIRIRTWWEKNRQGIKKFGAEVAKRVAKRMDRIIRNIGILILMGVIVNIISSYFYPEFPNRFPVIYGWFDGWLQVGELALKAGLGSIYALFTGNLGEFWAEYSNAVKELLQQFTSWLSLIKF